MIVIKDGSSLLEHVIAAATDASVWQYIDKNGRTVIRPSTFDNGPDPFHEGLGCVTKDGKIGFFNKNNVPVIMPLPFPKAMPPSAKAAARKKMASTGPLKAPGGNL